MKGLISAGSVGKVVGLVVVSGLMVFFGAQLLFPQEVKEIRPSQPPKTQDTTLRVGSEYPTNKEAKKVSERENKSSSVEKSGKTPPRFPGPDAILEAQIHIRTEEDVKTLRDLGLECCADTGVCECQVSMKQLMKLRGHGLEVIKASRVDITKREEETRTKSNESIPPKPKIEQSNDHTPQKIQADEIFTLKVKIKTKEEEQIIQRIGLNCGGEGKKECTCHAILDQVEELKKAGIEFEVRRVTKIDKK
jgi:hypothetical protein